MKIVQALCLGFLFLACDGSADATKALAEEIARIKAEGGPTTIAELYALYPPLPKDKDATRLWLPALPDPFVPGSEAFDEFSRSLPHNVAGEVNGNFMPEPGKEWPDRAKALEALEKNKAWIASMREAVRVGGAARFPTQIEYGMSALLPHIESLRSGAVLLSLEAKVAVHEGDPKRAFEAIHAGFMLGKSLREFPSMLGQLARAAIDSIALDTLNGSLSYLDYSVPQLQKFRQDLGEARYEESLAMASRGERVMVISLSQDPLQGAVPLSWEKGEMLGTQLGSLRASRAVLEASSKSFSKSLEQIRKIQVEAGEPEALPRRGEYEGLKRSTPEQFVYQTMINAYAFGYSKFAFTAASLRCVDALIAAKLHLSDNGGLPSSWEELVPQYLKTIPQDPFAEAPIRFAKEADGIRIYSVGVNGKDDQGRKDEADSKQGDIVFALNAPQEK